MLYINCLIFYETCWMRTAPTFKPVRRFRCGWCFECTHWRSFIQTHIKIGGSAFLSTLENVSNVVTGCCRHLFYTFTSFFTISFFLYISKIGPVYIYKCNIRLLYVPISHNNKITWQYCVNNIVSTWCKTRRDLSDQATFFHVPVLMLTCPL